MFIMHGKLHFSGKREINVCFSLSLAEPDTSLEILKKKKNIWKVQKSIENILFEIFVNIQQVPKVVFKTCEQGNKSIDSSPKMEFHPF